MKNFKISFWLFTLTTILLINACSKNEFDQTADTKESEMAESNLTRAHGEEEGVIERELIPRKQPRDFVLEPVSPPLITSDIIYELRDLPINIIVEENPQGGRFLTTQGKSREVNFAQYNKTVNQRFYIKTFPPSAGIKYQIISMQTNTPLGVGSYDKEPDVNILMTLPNDSDNWSAPWDFIPGKTEGTLVIINQHIMDGGPNYTNMYYVTIGAQKNKVLLSKYVNARNQEFLLAPIEDFTIQSIEFINDATALLSHKPSKILKDGYSNNGPVEQNFSLQISEEVTETSSFSNRSGVSVNVSTSFKVGCPIFAEGKITTSTTTSYEHTYGESSTIRRSISRQYPVKIPSMYRADLSVTLFEDKIDMNYIATCRGNESGRIIKLRGMWKGVSVSQGEAALTMTPLNSRQAVINYIYDDTNKKWVLKE